jgi:hypothetical protein
VIKRVFLVLTMTAMLLAMVLTVPVSAQDFGSKGGYEDEPRAPDCDWYGPYEERPWDPWWEYWCYWHGWGWEFVFWVWA